MNSRRSRSSSGRPANGVKRTKQGQPGNGQKKAKQEKETNNDLLTTVRDLIQQNDSDTVDRQRDGNNDFDHRDKRTIDENLMIKYRPLLTQKGIDEKHVTEAEEFLKKNEMDCTFVGMSRAINKLNRELRTVQMKLNSDQIISMQTTANEKKKQVEDFRLFLTKKTYNMFRVTFAMVRNSLIVTQHLTISCPLTLSIVTISLTLLLQNH